MRSRPSGRPDDMVRMLTDPSVPGWAHILAAGGTFTWETWTPSDLIGDSMSHGWGSSALVAMQETLLGVSLEEPNPDGTVRVAVAPAVGGAGPRRGLDADDRRPRHGVVAAAGSRGMALDVDRAGQRLGLGAPAGLGSRRVSGRAVVAATKAPGVAVSSTGGREGRALGRKRDLPFHQRIGSS